MTDKDLKTIFEKIESLHDKILKSRFAETVTEGEMMSLVLAVRVLSEQQSEIERLHTEKDNLIKTFAEGQKDVIKEFAEKLKDTKFKQGNDYIIYASNIDILVKEIVGDIG